MLYVNIIVVHFWSQAWKSVFTNELMLDKLQSP